MQKLPGLSLSFQRIDIELHVEASWLIPQYLEDRHRTTYRCFLACPSVFRGQTQNYMQKLPGLSLSIQRIDIELHVDASWLVPQHLEDRHRTTCRCFLACPSAFRGYTQNYMQMLPGLSLSIQRINIELHVDASWLVPQYLEDKHRTTCRCFLACPSVFRGYTQNYMQMLPGLSLSIQRIHIELHVNASWLVPQHLEDRHRTTCRCFLACPSIFRGQTQNYMQMLPGLSLNIQRIELHVDASWLGPQYLEDRHRTTCRCFLACPQYLEDRHRTTCRCFMAWPSAFRGQTQNYMQMLPGLPSVFRVQTQNYIQMLHGLSLSIQRIDIELHVDASWLGPQHFEYRPRTTYRCFMACPSAFRGQTQNYVEASWLAPQYLEDGHRTICRCFLACPSVFRGQNQDYMQMLPGLSLSIQRIDIELHVDASWLVPQYLEDRTRTT